MALYDTIDLQWSWDGDISIGPDGDLADTKDDLIQSFVNEIQTVIKSEIGDWEQHPTLGANLSNFRGESNSRENARKMERQIISRLGGSGIVKSEDLAVRIIPTGRYEIMIMIRINAAATSRNSLRTGEPISVNLIYNSSEDSVFFLPETDLERSFRGF
jgi:hypothetical protein